MTNPVAPLALLATLMIAAPAVAQPSAAIVLEETVAPGANYDKAEFKLWVSNDTASVRAIALLVPGSNGDGRGQVDDPVWQAFAVKHQLALVGLHLTDKPHDQGFIEEYVNVSQGSGQALLDALDTLAARSKHSELSSVPFLLW